MNSTKARKCVKCAIPQCLLSLLIYTHRTHNKGQIRELQIAITSKL